MSDAPGKIELFETEALVIGYGTIGRMIDERLSAFGVAVTGMTRSGRDDTLTPDAWQGRLGEFDWVILAASPHCCDEGDHRRARTRGDEAVRLAHVALSMSPLGLRRLRPRTYGRF